MSLAHLHEGNSINRSERAEFAASSEDVRKSMLSTDPPKLTRAVNSLRCSRVYNLLLAGIGSVQSVFDLVALYNFATYSIDCLSSERCEY